MEGVALNRVCILGRFCPKQGRGFKWPSGTHLYPNIGQVPAQGFLFLVPTVIAPDTGCLNFLPLNSAPKRRQPFRAPSKAQNKLCQFINWGQLAATVIIERVMNREHKCHAGNVLGGGQENQKEFT